MRIVIEIDPDLKQNLYEALGEEGISLKQWFLERVDGYLTGRVQLELLLEGANDTFSGKERGRL